MTASEVRADFDALWKDVALNYAYFDSRLTNWAAVPDLYEADRAKVKTLKDFIGVLERVLDELCDAHAQLTVNTARSPRLVPSGADVWAEWAGGKAIVLEVRERRTRIAPGSAPAPRSSRSMTSRSETR